MGVGSGTEGNIETFSQVEVTATLAGRLSALMSALMPELEVSSESGGRADHITSAAQRRVDKGQVTWR